MKNVDVDDILEFKETLSVLLISGLFILLASRIDFTAIMQIGISIVFVLIAIMFLVRPLSVIVSAIGTDLNWKEKTLLSWIAPRGIVAASVSALFAIKLEAINYPQADMIVPIVFIVIIVTVVLQSLTAAKLAELLNIRSPKPNGVLIFGGGEFSRLCAKELQNQNITVCLADTNWEAISQARMMDIPNYFGNPISEHATRNLDLSAIGRVLVMSPYQQLNPLVSFHFEHEIGKGSVLGLKINEKQVRPSHQASESYNKKMNLFNDRATYAQLVNYAKKGASVKTTKLTDEFTYADYLNEYKQRCVPLFAIDANHKLEIFTATSNVTPKKDWRIISLILP